MGAENFSTTGTGTSVTEAFRDAQDSAFWEHGHGGYTGTIAEKPGCRLFELPVGQSIEAIERALSDAWNPDAERPAWLTDELYETYNDKWGPAVAFQDPTDPKTWHFMGWASC